MNDVALTELCNANECIKIASTYLFDAIIELQK